MAEISGMHVICGNCHKSHFGRQTYFDKLKDYICDDCYKKMEVAQWMLYCMEGCNFKHTSKRIYEVDMPCNCKNEDGSLAGRCFGTCKIDVIVEQEMQQQRDPLNGFAELVMSQVEKLVTRRLDIFRIEMMKYNREISHEDFIKGLKEGIKIAKEIDDGY